MMNKRKFRLWSASSLWLPILAVFLSAAVVLVPAIRVYLRWKASIGSGDTLVLSSGEFQMAIPRERMLRSAVEMNAMRQQGTVALLNAPGHLLGVLPRNWPSTMRTVTPIF
jgi:hypothetical protein